MFFRCKTPDETKKLFRRLALHLHPDKGGEDDLMILLQEAYQLHLDGISTWEESKKDTEKTTEKQKEEPEYPGSYQQVYEDVTKDNPILDIFKDILEYAKNHKNFKTDYTKSLIEFLEENGFITSSQYNGLVRIYYSFRMHVKKEEK